MKFLNKKGIGAIGVIIFLLIAGVIGGGSYYYFQKPMPADEAFNTQESIVPENEIIPQEVVSIVTCQNECSTNGNKKCSNGGYQICANYDDDDCLEWSSINNCSPATICQGGSCVQKKCIDGTPWMQCSITKPLHCENGTLLEDVSLCGCPSDYEVYGTQCRQKLSNECGILYEGAKDYTDAVNFVIVPADSLYGMLLDDPNAQYSNNFDAFIVDARNNINDFLFVDPINKYKNIFNFYYATNITGCTIRDGWVVCDSWEEIADGCGISYDVAIILQRKEGGGLCCKPIQSSAFSSYTFVHEISHYFGFRDYDYLAIPFGPNHCNDLACCGGEVCEFENWWDQKPIEQGGPECCLYQGELDGISFYIPNEQSAMNYGVDYRALKFNYLERAYLEKLFAKILSSGKESVRCGEQQLNLEEYCKPIIKGKKM